MKRIGNFALAAALAIGLLGSAAAQTVTLKFHTFMAPQSAVWKDMHTVWMDRVEQASNGRIRFERYPAMQLGGTPANLFDHAREGVADIVWTIPGYTSGRFPRSEVFELPFMMTRAEATSRAYWEYLQTHAGDEFREVHLLAAHVHGPGVLHTRSRRVESVADIRGLKLRGPTRLATRLLSALGATPVGMPLPQIPDALSKGVIEGALLPWEVVPSVRVQELVRYHTEFEPGVPALYTTAFVMAMNKAKYEALPPDLRRIIDEHSGIETSAWLGKTQEGNDDAGRKTAVDRGNGVVRLDENAYAEFRQAADRVDDDWVREMDRKGFDGRALLESARALTRKHGG